ncbi:MAG: lipopolysaccharide kinase InaA family protein [Planctomycetota bacterium]
MDSRARTEIGRVTLRGEEGILAAVRPLVDLAARRGTRERGVREVAGLALRIKADPLRGRASLRHAVRALWPGIEVPRLQEFANLAWLRRNGFGAPRPLAAGCYRNALGLPVYQFLFTEEVAGARTLTEVFEAGPRELRRPALEALGRDLARLHGRGFVHRDLFPRNLLVTAGGEGARIHFLDAWRGGPLPGLRGPAYDLACLMLFGTDLFAPDEEGALFRAYFGERARLGHAVRPARLLAAAARLRRGLRRRFVRRRWPGSVLPIPREDWTPAGLG